MNTNQYETVIILTPVLSEQQMKDAVDNGPHKAKEYVLSKNSDEIIKAIDEIFTEKKHAEYYEFACIPIFRDVLIFKNKSKVVGIAKICFTCNNSVIVGTNANTEEFGMSGDYEKLSEILYEE